MNEGVTMNCRFHVARQGRRAKVHDGEKKAGGKAVPTPVPRISRLMALAIRFDGLIRDRVVANLAELAALGHVSRARASQIMNLLNVAPDIQEDLLYLEHESGRQSVTERTLRLIVAEVDWERQRGMWGQLPAG